MGEEVPELVRLDDGRRAAAEMDMRHCKRSREVALYENDLLRQCAEVGLDGIVPDGNRSVEAAIPASACKKGCGHRWTRSLPRRSRRATPRMSPDLWRR